MYTYIITVQTINTHKKMNQNVFWSSSTSTTFQNAWTNTNTHLLT